MFAHLEVLPKSITSLVDLIKIINYSSEIYPKSRIQHFENPLSYYAVAGFQVKFNRHKNIFAIHLPILSGEIFKSNNSGISLPNTRHKTVPVREQPMSRI